MNPCDSIDELGRALYGRFDSLGSALKFAYPEIKWDLTKFSLKGKKSGQRLLKTILEELLPRVDIVEDYQHCEIAWGVLFVIPSDEASEIGSPRGVRCLDSGVSNWL